MLHDHYLGDVHPLPCWPTRRIICPASLLDLRLRGCWSHIGQGSEGRKL